MNFERMFTSSLFILRSSSSLALAFRKSEMNVVRPLIVDTLSEEKRLVAPMPPGLRTVVARFNLLDRGHDEVVQKLRPFRHALTFA